VTYLPAPYESAQQDDMAAALAAGLTISTAAITSWVLGSFCYESIRSIVERVHNTADLKDIPADELVPTTGWAVAVVLMVFGAVMLLARRGRSSVVCGSLIAIATTAVAQFSYHYPEVAQRSSAAQLHLEHWPLFWGGVVVLLAAVLPATGRWVNSTGKSGRPSSDPLGFPGGPSTSSATLWPGT
jgi:hypothetical protein